MIYPRGLLSRHYGMIGICGVLEQDWETCDTMYLWLTSNFERCRAFSNVQNLALWMTSIVRLNTGIYSSIPGYLFPEIINYSLKMHFFPRKISFCSRIFNRGMRHKRAETEWYFPGILGVKRIFSVAETFY